MRRFWTNAFSRTGTDKAAPHGLTMGHYWRAPVKLKLGRISPIRGIDWR
jgi:hypothetical protein